EVNFFGVEQRAVHVEQNGADVPFAGHDAATRAAYATFFRRQSGHRQSPPSDGIGRRKSSAAHQQGPDGLQVNSVPQPEQARRREVPGLLSTAAVGKAVFDYQFEIKQARDVASKSAPPAATDAKEQRRNLSLNSIATDIMAKEPPAKPPENANAAMANPSATS